MQNMLLFKIQGPISYDGIKICLKEFSIYLLKICKVVSMTN